MENEATEELTLQLMFDRAWNGLKSQGWERCVRGILGDCVYRVTLEDGTVRHCAWGWVDKDSWPYGNVAFGQLSTPTAVAARNITNACSLARALQVAHDGGFTEMEGMEVRMRQVAARFKLKVPD